VVALWQHRHKCCSHGFTDNTMVICCCAELQAWILLRSYLASGGALFGDSVYINIDVATLVSKSSFSADSNCGHVQQWAWLSWRVQGHRGIHLPRLRE